MKIVQRDGEDQIHLGDVIDLQSGPRKERHEVKHMECKRESMRERSIAVINHLAASELSAVQDHLPTSASNLMDYRDTFHPQIITSSFVRLTSTVPHRLPNSRSFDLCPRTALASVDWNRIGQFALTGCQDVHCAGREEACTIHASSPAGVRHPSFTRLLEQLYCTASRCMNSASVHCTKTTSSRP
ncbi:hypothetical protein CBL_01967 [Carabus blaptoides fortunei]